MNAKQIRALNRLQIFLNWCYDRHQDAAGLLKIIKKDFEFFNDCFTDAAVRSFLKSKDASLSFAISLADTTLKKYTA